MNVHHNNIPKFPGQINLTEKVSSDPCPEEFWQLVHHRSIQDHVFVQEHISHVLFKFWNPVLASAKYELAYTAK